MLRTRVIVGAVALPVLLVVVLIGGALFASFMLVVLLLGADEYVRLLKQGEFNPPRWLMGALILIAVGAVWFDKPDWYVPGLVGLLIVGVFGSIWGMEHGAARPVLDMALAVWGGVYLGWLGSTLLAIRLLDDGAALAIVLYVCVAGTDSAAYFVGRQWGRHKLSPRVSPKKTWEGYAGSVISGPIIGLLAALVVGHAVLPVGQGMIIGLLVGVLGTVGDLAISVIKRQVNAKDSSHLIPGHGGILDRTDSVLVAAAIGYYYLVWFVQ